MAMPWLKGMMALGLFGQGPRPWLGTEQAADFHSDVRGVFVVDAVFLRFACPSDGGAGGRFGSWSVLVPLEIASTLSLWCVFKVKPKRVHLWEPWAMA